MMILIDLGDLSKLKEKKVIRIKHERNNADFELSKDILTTWWKIFCNA